MNSSELYIEVAELKDELQQALYHPYIYQYVKPPVIDDEKLLLLCSITNETSRLKRKEMIISTMLAQTALDVHERILHIDLITNNHKARQLTVLAGDYYSSLYYERLTGINNQELVRLLAYGIKEINELKTLFLYGNKIDLTKLMEIQKKIESNIINQFSIATEGKEIPDEIKQLLLLKRLIQERMLDEHGEQSIWIHLFGRHISKKKPSRHIELLPQTLYREALQVLETVIIEKYRQLEPLLKNSDSKIIRSIFNNQTELLLKIEQLLEER